jgi:MFS family permease
MESTIGTYEETDALDRAAGVDASLAAQASEASFQFSYSQAETQRSSREASTSQRPQHPRYGALLWSMVRAMGTGAGMFIAAYFLITTGQLKTIWEAAYPTCWLGAIHGNVNCANQVRCPGLFPQCTSAPCQDFIPGFCTGPNGGYPSQYTCSNSVLIANSCVVFGGIMLGMLGFGWVADAIGRRFAAICSAAIMVVGALIMTFAYSGDISSMFIVLSSFFGVLGLGIGGEYPISASRAAEHKQQLEHVSSRERRKLQTRWRGASLTLVFSMQGIGILFGSLLTLIAIVVAKQASPTCTIQSNNEMGYAQRALSFVWRFVYGVGALWLISLLLHRIIFSKEEEAFRRTAKRREARRKHHPGLGTAYRQLLVYYWSRLIGTGVTWFINDVILYGNRLYSGPIFNGINQNADLLVQNGWILLNNGVSLVGYYISAVVIDRSWCGRRRLQLFGFLMIGIFFAILAGTYDRFRTTNRHALIALYILASVFSQIGPNVVTYVGAAELYPSEVRARAHGLSAFCGKLGALVSTLTFGYVSIQTIFILSACAAGIGFVTTLVFLPDATGLDLREHDWEWELALRNRAQDYGGEASCRRHLSLCERWQGRGRRYNQQWRAFLQVEKRTPDAISLTMPLAVSPAVLHPFTSEP